MRHWTFAVALLISLGAVACGDDDSGALTRGAAPGSNPEGPTDGCTAPDALAQRITKLEYNNVIRDIFQIEDDFAANFSAPQAGTAGFTTETEAQVLSSAIVNDFWAASGSVVDAVFSRSANPLLTCTGGEACARTILTNLTTRAFRRPATADELDKLVALFRGSSSSVFTDAMKLAVRAVLVSPQFIFRTYDLPSDGATEAPLTDYELASRLSFALWGSVPDDPLLADAAQGRIHDSTVLEGHLRRMLKDKRASYLRQAFATQWLGLDAIDDVTLDPTLFPKWNASLQASAKMETQTFFERLISDDRSVLDIVGANYTFADSNLGTLYGISGGAPGLVQTNLGPNRAGILTHASILAVNSTATRTAPVRRGKWVLERILCENVPPAPPNVPALPPPNAGDPNDDSQIRQRLAAHTAQPACAGCHKTLDPVGFVFENFDPTGAFRTTYRNGAPVDASGQLPTGEHIGNYMDLAALLEKDSRFPTCLAAKLASFAEGRQVTSSSDACAVKSAVASLGATSSFSNLLVGIVTGSAFRNRHVSY